MTAKEEILLVPDAEMPSLRGTELNVVSSYSMPRLPTAEELERRAVLVGIDEVGGILIEIRNTLTALLIDSRLANHKLRMLVDHAAAGMSQYYENADMARREAGFVLNQAAEEHTHKL